MSAPAPARQPAWTPGRRPAFLVTTAAADTTGRPWGMTWLYVYEDELATRPRDPRPRAAHEIAKIKTRAIINEDRPADAVATVPLIVRVVRLVEQAPALHGRVAEG